MRKRKQNRNVNSTVQRGYQQHCQHDTNAKAAHYQTLHFQSKPSIAGLADLFAKLLPTLKTEKARPFVRGQAF